MGTFCICFLLLSPSFVAGSSPGGGGERACEEKAPHSQQDGHVCHRFCGQILLPIRPCYQSCYGVQIRSAPSGVGHPSAGTGGTVGCHRRHLQSHAGQAQRDRCGLWVNHGLHAVQCGGVFLAVTPQCPCSLCTVESLRAAMKRKPLVV